MDAGIRVSNILNDIFGRKRGEMVQDEIIDIFHLLEKQFKSDRKAGEK